MPELDSSGSGGEVTIASLDSSKLQGATGELYILQYLKNVKAALRDWDQAAVTERRQDLSNTLSLFLPTVSSSPASRSVVPASMLSRPVRRGLARIWIALFDKSDTKGLHDVLQQWISLVQDPDVHVNHQLAAMHLVAEVFNVHGGKVLSLYRDIITMSSKVSRSTVTAIKSRVAALRCITTALPHGAATDREPAVRELSKLLQRLLIEKLGPIQREAAEALTTLWLASPYLHNMQDIESTLSASFKLLDTSNWLTRRAIVTLAATLLMTTQIERLPSHSGRSAASRDEAGDSAVEHATEVESSGTARGSVMQTASLLSTTEMLDRLASIYNRSSSTATARNVIIDIYATLFACLGRPYVQKTFLAIFEHLSANIADGAYGQSSNRGRKLSREYCRLLLEEVIIEKLSRDEGRNLFLDGIVAHYLKKYPALMPGSPEPPRTILIMASLTVACLFRHFGPTPRPFNPDISESLLRLASHPDFTVRTYACTALVERVRVEPSHTEGLTRDVHSRLKRALKLSVNGTLGSQTPTISGLSMIFAALLATSRTIPLYAASDLAEVAMSQALDMLKMTNSDDINVNAATVKGAWTLIGALLIQDDTFVIAHLPQLQLLWRNALPKSASNEDPAGHRASAGEYAFLLTVRESSLDALNVLLATHPGLLSSEASKRLAKQIIVAIDEPPFERAHLALSSSPFPIQISPHSVLSSYLAGYRAKLLTALAAFGNSEVVANARPVLVRLLLRTFAEPSYLPEPDAQSPFDLSHTCATSVWELSDGWAYGVVSPSYGNFHHSDPTSPTIGDLDVEVGVELQLEVLMRRPDLAALRYDQNGMLQEKGPVHALLYDREVPAQALVTRAVTYFGQQFALLDALLRADLFNQSMAFLRALDASDKPALQKQAVRINMTIAFALALRRAEPAQRANETQLHEDLASFFRSSLASKDANLRSLASEGIGRLCVLTKNNFVANQVQACVTQVISQTNAESRAGSASALAEIYRHVGILAAEPSLKTAFDLLSSLCLDPHPLVHTWALRSLATVINSAGLAFRPFAPMTIGMLYKVYTLDTHDPDSSAPAVIDIACSLPAREALGQVLEALIGALGPDLEIIPHLNSSISVVLDGLLNEDGYSGQAYAAKALQALMAVSPTSVPLAYVADIVRQQLRSDIPPLRSAAVTSIYQIVRLDVTWATKMGGDTFIEGLFAILDDEPDVEGVKATIHCWISQTATVNPVGWVELCERVLKKDRRNSPAVPKLEPTRPVLVEEETAQLGADENDAPQRQPATLRWQTQLFVVECLILLVRVVFESGERHHFNTVIARELQVNSNSILLSKVGDLVRVAFVASTAPVIRVKLAGLALLRNVLEVYSQCLDIQFENAPLLEQYQAAITAALVPAFGEDSSPEIVSEALHVASLFASSASVRNLDDIARVTKILSLSLRAVLGGRLGDCCKISTLASNAEALLHISIASAWAKLYIESLHNRQLALWIAPDRESLSALWLRCMRQIAGLNLSRAEDRALVRVAGGDAIFAGLSQIPKQLYAPTSYMILEAIAISFLSVPAQEVLDSDIVMLESLVFESLTEAVTHEVQGSALRQTLLSLRILSKALKSHVRCNWPIKQALQDELLLLLSRLYLLQEAAIDIVLVECIPSLVQLAIIDLSGNQEPIDTLVAPWLKVLCGIVKRRSQGGDSANDVLDSALGAIMACQQALLHSGMDLSVVIFALLNDIVEASSLTRMSSELLKHIKSLCISAGSLASGRVAMEGFISITSNRLENMLSHSDAAISPLLSITCSVLLVSLSAAAESATRFSRAVVQHAASALTRLLSRSETYVLEVAAQTVRALTLVKAENRAPSQYLLMNITIAGMQNAAISLPGTADKLPLAASALAALDMAWRAPALVPLLLLAYLNLFDQMTTKGDGVLNVGESLLRLIRDRPNECHDATRRLTSQEKARLQDIVQKAAARSEHLSVASHASQSIALKSFS